MCVRRFLILVFILTLMVVGGAFAIYQWGGDLLVRMATPKGHYEAPPRGSGPDYASKESWIARPDVADDPSDWLPSSVASGTANPAAAIFYVHPTTYLEREHWNAPLENQESQRRAALFVKSQASALTGAGQVWAPKYRQAAYGAFLLKSRDAQQALDLAYSDVARAFDAFIAGTPATAPIILAGHSQGSLHLSRLMREKVARTPLARRIASAYVVGWPLSAAADIPAMGLPACRTEAEAGCILSWQSFKEPANVSLITDVYDGSRGPNGVVRERRDMVCTNPLTGTANSAAASSTNLATLVPNANYSTAELVAGRVGARCDGGFLMIDGDVPNLGAYVLPGNNYHVYDYALFWGSIRADAAKRVAAWRR